MSVYLSVCLSACLSVGYLCISALLQVPSKVLLLAGCAACIGGTFQYGYNISVINAPTKVNETSVCLLVLDVTCARLLIEQTHKVFK